MTRCTVGQILKHQTSHELKVSIERIFSTTTINLSSFIDLIVVLWRDIRHPYDGMPLEVLMIDQFRLFSRSNIEHAPSSLKFTTAFNPMSCILFDLIICISHEKVSTELVDICARGNLIYFEVTSRKNHDLKTSRNYIHHILTA